MALNTLIGSSHEKAIIEPNEVLKAASVDDSVDEMNRVSKTKEQMPMELDLEQFLRSSQIVTSTSLLSDGRS